MGAPHAHSSYLSHCPLPANSIKSPSSNYLRSPHLVDVRRPTHLPHSLPAPLPTPPAPIPVSVVVPCSSVVPRLMPPPPEPTALTPTQSKCTPAKLCIGMMVPRLEALLHPAAPALRLYSSKGCPVDCGPPWTLPMLLAAIAKGAHPTARVPEAAKCCHQETLAKVDAGFARIINWADICDNHPPELKISPIAAVPHKSRIYRMILDLSFSVRMPDGTRIPSVNDSSDKTLVDHTSMSQLGNVIPRIVATMAHAPPDTPFYFVKFDIKDGFWRLAVSSSDAWNFAYALPQLNPTAPIQLVIPTALQMGWCESPPFFCAASETARDVAHLMALRPFLPAHPLESLTLAPSDFSILSIDQARETPATHLFEVYIDDFIGVVQTHEPNELRHFSRALLHGIHTVFPPPGVAGFTGDEPVSMKKLLSGEGVWHTRKEILGWMFDGHSRCIELPSDKRTKLLLELYRLRQLRTINFKDLEKLRGKLQWTSIAIPLGKPLLGPLDYALRVAAANKHFSIHRTDDDPLTMALRDWSSIIKLFTRHPTHVREIVPAPPDYVGYCDASKLGAGGVWFSGRLHLRPTVWRHEWPAWVQDNFLSADNPTGIVTNSDLEMAGLLLHWCALEPLVHLNHTHVAIYCDNTPTVSWVRRLNSTRSRIAARLLRALSCRLRTKRASPLSALSIAGKNNIMADVSSRTFHKNTATGHTFAVSDYAFLTNFSFSFPLPQPACWQMLRLSTKVTSAVLSELQTMPSTLASWLRLSATGTAIGTIGLSSLPPSLTWTPSSKHPPRLSDSTPSSVLLSGSGTALSPKDDAFALHPSKLRFAPSARPSNWLATPTQPMLPRTATTSASIGSSNHTGETTPLHSPRLPSRSGSPSTSISSASPLPLL